MIIAEQHTVAGTAVLLVSASIGFRVVNVHVTSNQPLYIGPAGVTTSTGFYIDKNSGVTQYVLSPGDSLYGISGGTTETVTTLITAP